MDEDIKFKIKLIIGFTCICIFLYVLFISGASYGCNSGGGILVKENNSMRCLDLNNTDLCREYTGRIIKKEINPFNFTINYNKSIGVN